MLFTIFKIATRNIFKHKTRSLILCTAIITVSTLLMIINNITSGIKENLMYAATTLFSGHLNVGGFYKINASSAAPVITDIYNLKKVVTTIVPDALYIVDRVNGYGKIISDQDSIQLPMMGIDVIEEKDILKNLRPLAGNIFDLKQGSGIIIFESQAKTLKVTTGDMVTVSIPTYRNIYNTKDLKIVAVLKDMGFLSKFSAFLNKRDLQEIYSMKEDSSGRIMIFLNDLSKRNFYENKLRKNLAVHNYQLMDQDPRPFWMKFEKVAGEGWTGQKLDITNWEDEVSMMKWIITLFDVITFILTTILLSIIALGLMNILWIAIKERTQEIGTMRAIGAQKHFILTLFLFEPLILSTISVSLGILLGSVLTVIINYLEIKIPSGAFQAFLMSDTLTLSTNPFNLIIILVTISIFTTLGAILPAWMASKLRPIVAMKN